MTDQAHTLPRRLDPHFVYVFDALGSFVFGIVLLFAATPLTELVRWTLPSAFLWILGMLLLPWAGFNIWIARNAHPPRGAVTANIVGDVIWVGGTAALLAINAMSLSGYGMVLLAGQGIAVCGILALKLIGRDGLVR